MYCSQILWVRGRQWGQEAWSMGARSSTFIWWIRILNWSVVMMSWKLFLSYDPNCLLKITGGSSSYILTDTKWTKNLARQIWLYNYLDSRIYHMKLTKKRLMADHICNILQQLLILCDRKSDKTFKRPKVEWSTTQMMSGAERASDDIRNVCGVGCGTERNTNYFTNITVHIGTWGACASKQNDSQTVSRSSTETQQNCYTHAGGKSQPDPCNGEPWVIKSIMD